MPGPEDLSSYYTAYPAPISVLETVGYRRPGHMGHCKLLSSALPPCSNPATSLRACRSAALIFNIAPRCSLTASSRALDALLCASCAAVLSAGRGGGQEGRCAWQKAVPPF